MNKMYHKIKFTFKQEGGCEDFEDVFVCWINLASAEIDYLGYLYNEVKGAGFIFREACNERYVNGIGLVDCNNYKPLTENDIKVHVLDVLFEEGKLNLLSKIELKNINVVL